MHAVYEMVQDLRRRRRGWDGMRCDSDVTRGGGGKGDVMWRARQISAMRCNSKPLFTTLFAEERERSNFAYANHNVNRGNNLCESVTLCTVHALSIVFVFIAIRSFQPWRSLKVALLIHATDKLRYSKEILTLYDNGCPLFIVVLIPIFALRKTFAP